MFCFGLDRQQLFWTQTFTQYFSLSRTQANTLNFVVPVLNNNRVSLDLVYRNNLCCPNLFPNYFCLFGPTGSSVCGSAELNSVHYNLFTGLIPLVIAIVVYVIYLFRKWFSIFDFTIDGLNYRFSINVFSSSVFH